MGGGLENRCVGRVYGADGAVRQHSVIGVKYRPQESGMKFLQTLFKFITECRARHHTHRKHDLHSGSQDHHPSKNSAQKTICCYSTCSAPDGGRMYPKHVEVRIYQ